MALSDQWQIIMRNRLPAQHRLEQLSVKDKALCEAIDIELRRIKEQINALHAAGSAEVD